MKVCILMGSPRQNGNTASVVRPFVTELKKHDAEINIINLYEKTIKPCIGCRKCQDVSGSFGCPQKDDMQFIFDSVNEADIFILATPIYSWYCTPPMKAALDRLVYGMNKYYGNTAQKECLWENKICAIITTCGYRVEKGADLFEEGIVRYCKHSNLDYTGMLAIRDEGYHTSFINDQKIEQAKLFADQIAISFEHRAKILEAELSRLSGEPTYTVEHIRNITGKVNVLDQIISGSHDRHS